MILFSVLLFPKWYNVIAEGRGEASGTAHSELPCVQAGFWTDEEWDIASENEKSLALLLSWLQKVDAGE